MGEKIKIAIIGVGSIANSIHLPIITQNNKYNNHTEIVAICDINLKRAEEAANKYNIKNIYVSYIEMLEKQEFDVAFVLTQPDQLYRIVADCLIANKHVFMEKPMGITAFQAETLRGYAIEKKRILHAGFNRRYIPLVREVVSQINKLTKINQVAGYFYKNSTASFYGGCASSFECDVIHCIDLVRHIAGGNAHVSQASTIETIDLKDNVPNAWHSSFRFENGIVGVIGASYKSGGRVHRFEIHGEGASAYINLGFGSGGCDAQILCDGASFSIISGGEGEKNVKNFDGVKLAGSENYYDFYGYKDEDELFLNKVLEYKGETDLERVNEDLSSMRLVENLLKAKK